MLSQVPVRGERGAVLIVAVFFIRVGGAEGVSTVPNHVLKVPFRTDRFVTDLRVDNAVDLGELASYSSVTAVEGAIDIRSTWCTFPGLSDAQRYSILESAFANIVEIRGFLRVRLPKEGVGFLRIQVAQLTLSAPP